MYCARNLLLTVDGTTTEGNSVSMFRHVYHWLQRNTQYELKHNVDTRKNYHWDILVKRFK